jgi:hypothetical protein
LITGTEVSATAISAAVGGVSHDTLTRVLNGGWWTARLVMLAAVRVVNWVGGEGWLIVDDVLIPKPYARLIAFCGWDCDHALRRNVFGLRLVFVVWCNGWLTLPLGFYVWQKDPTRSLGKKRPRRKPGRPRKRGPKVRSHTRQARLQRARRRALHHAQKRVRPRTATGTHSHTKNALARALVWHVVRAGVKVRCIAFDHWYASCENLDCFTRLGLVWVTRLKHNTIECFFRDAKQLLGLGCSPVRQPQAVLTHLVLVHVASVFLQLLKPLSPKPHVSVSQSKKALLPLRLLVTTTGAASLVRLTADGHYEPVEVEELWEPVRTRLSGIELPEHPWTSLSLYAPT